MMSYGESKLSIMSYKWQNLKISNVDVPNLPEEMWCLIFSYLPIESKKKATATCQLWFKIIRSDPKLSGLISQRKYDRSTKKVYILC